MAAKKKNKPHPAKKHPPRKRREKVQKVLHQVKEPLSLLQTLREEGLANAATFLTLASGFASGAARNFRAETIKPHLVPQLKELVGSLGFALREDLDRLQERVEELEQRLAEREYRDLRAEDGDDE